MQPDREIVGKFIDAAVNDQAEAKRLLDANPQLRNATWLGDEHLLTFLVIENSASGVAFCLNNGFDPNRTDGEFGTTPLHYSCKLDYPRIADLLLQSGADPNAVSEIDDTPIHCAIQNGNVELIKALIEHGADPNYRTDLGETIFDNWPPSTEKDLSAFIAKLNICKPNGGITNG